MNSLTEHINQILQQEDIEGLIEAGAPSDEYSSEVEAIAAIVMNLSGQGVEVLENAIYEFWQNIFNLSDHDMKLRSEAVHRVAANIINR